MKLEELKKKVEQAKERAKDLDNREKVIQSSEEQIKLITESLNALNEYLVVEGKKDIEGALNSFTKALTQLEKSANESEANFKKEILKAISSIEGFIEKQAAVKQDEIPNTTSYVRSNGRISRVIEAYDKYTLIYIWNYDGDGNLIKVTTTKNVKTS